MLGILFCLMEKIRVGNIVNTFGIRGELKIRSLTDFPEQRYAPKSRLIIEKDGRDVEVTVKKSRFHKNHWLLLFEDMEDINLVEQFKDCDLFVARKERHDLTDGYYTSDLLGMKVISEEKVLGVVSDVDSYPMHNVLRVKREEGEFLVPFVDAFIKKVDLEKKEITIKVIEGLI